jgi:hypothetical protein
VSRELLEMVCEDLLARALQPVYGVLRDAGVHPDDVDDVVMVGGSSRLVAVSIVAEGTSTHDALSLIGLRMRGWADVGAAAFGRLLPWPPKESRCESRHGHRGGRRSEFRVLTRYETLNWVETR